MTRNGASSSASASAYPPLWGNRRPGAQPPGSVLVVAAEPELPVVRAFGAALRGVVEDRVVAHQELQAAPRGRVRVVDHAVLEHERAEAGALGHVTGGIGP